MLSSALRPFLAALLPFALTISAACGPPPEPVAVARLALDRGRVPIGSSVEATIQFDVAPNLRSLDEDYRVFLDVLDDSNALLWSDEHDPPLPTSTWQPGQSIQYTHRVRIPPYPYLGPAVIALGLRSPISGERLALAGNDVGGFAYWVATLTLDPQHESSFVIYEDGWHQTEFDVFAQTVWRWTTGRAILSFRNPRSAASLTLTVQGAPNHFDHPQRLSFVVDGRTLRKATLTSNDAVHLEYDLTAAELGDTDVVRLELLVDQTFVPVDEDDSATDTRELGVRVLDVYIEPLP